MTRWLFILNDPPYGSERPYNALRLALNVLRTGSDDHVTLFLMGDSVAAARRGQSTLAGYYNVKDASLSRQAGWARAPVRDLHGRARHRGPLTELTRSCDRVLVF